MKNYPQNNSDLKVATDSPNRDFNDDVYIIDRQGVTSGGHLCNVKPLAIDTHVHLQQFKLARENQGVNVPRQEPAERVLSERNTTCTKGEHIQRLDK